MPDIQIIFTWCSLILSAINDVVPLTHHPYYGEMSLQWSGLLHPLNPNIANTQANYVVLWPEYLFCLKGHIENMGTWRMHINSFLKIVFLHILK